MVNVLLAGVLAGFLAAQPVSAANGEWTVSEDLTVREIAAGVWLHTSWQTLEGGGRFPGNGLVVRDGNKLLLVDTAWGVEHTEALLAWVEAEIGLPVGRAIVTHFHDDSMGGTPALAAREIPVVGNPMTRVLGADQGVPLPEPLADLEIGDALTVANVEVFYPGPGHSRDNLVVWVPEASVLFGSCAVRSPTFPGKGNTADADLSGWPQAIRRVQARYPDAKIVVPGHGPAGDASLLQHTIDLFE